jgi:hypothetical protein
MVISCPQMWYCYGHEKQVQHINVCVWWLWARTIREISLTLSLAA